MGAERLNTDTFIDFYQVLLELKQKEFTGEIKDPSDHVLTGEIESCIRIDGQSCDIVFDYQVSNHLYSDKFIENFQIIPEDGEAIWFDSEAQEKELASVITIKF